jgi:hypothetical protein
MTTLPTKPFHKGELADPRDRAPLPISKLPRHNIDGRFTSISGHPGTETTWTTSFVRTARRSVACMTIAGAEIRGPRRLGARPATPIPYKQMQPAKDTAVGDEHGHTGEILQQFRRSTDFEGRRKSEQYRSRRPARGRRSRPNPALVAKPVSRNCHWSDRGYRRSSGKPLLDRLSRTAAQAFRGQPAGKPGGGLS